MDENVALTLILASHATLINTKHFPQKNKNNVSTLPDVSGF